MTLTIETRPWVEGKTRDFLVSRVGTYFDANTAPEVAAALDTLRACHDRVRLWLGDPKTGENWLDEYDVCGTISRSMGPVKSPLLIHNARSSGGGAILTAHILAIRSTSGAWRYRHSLFKIPEFTKRPTVCDEPAEQSKSKMGSAAPMVADKYPWEVLNEARQVHARFETEAKADRWIAFMRGERFTK